MTGMHISQQKQDPSLWLAFANSHGPANTAFFWSCTLINSATSAPRDVSKVETERLALR